MTGKIYREEDTEYVYTRSNKIKDYADTMGVSATAVAAAIIKENNAYNASPYLNDALDKFASLHLGSDAAVRASIAGWESSYWNANDAKPGIVQKADYPVLIDMGIANIKVTTAVKLLDDYFVKYPNDPLNLSDYKNNAQDVVADLNNSDKNDLTAKLSTLMIREAQDFYTAPQTNAAGQALNISAKDWAAFSQEERDGLMVMYFTRGEESMRQARDANVAANGFFNPRLGDSESGGLWTLDNAALIGKAMDVPGYGDTASKTLGLELDPPADNTVAASLGANTPIPTAPAGLDTPTRNSASYFTPGTDDAHSMTVKPGGTLSDLWVAQKNTPNGFKNADEFYADVLASNPSITNVNQIQAGQTIFVPEKFADGSITYHMANGVSINNNAATGECQLVLPSADGGTVFFQRTVDAATGDIKSRYVESDAASGSERKVVETVISGQTGNLVESKTTETTLENGKTVTTETETHYTADNIETTRTRINGVLQDTETRRIDPDTGDTLVIRENAANDETQISTEHAARPGDTLASLTERYGIPASLLEKANPDLTQQLNDGGIISIPIQIGNNTALAGSPAAIGSDQQDDSAPLDKAPLHSLIQRTTNPNGEHELINALTVNGYNNNFSYNLNFPFELTPAFSAGDYHDTPHTEPDTTPVWCAVNDHLWRSAA